MMRYSKAKLITTTAMCLALTGCLSEDPSLEGISASGGNAIAHNTALQIVDPWPTNVHDNDIETPAEREADTSPTSPSTTSASADTSVSD